MNGVAVSKDGNTYYGATEWGGLYKSTDKGNKWLRLKNYIPMATWDIEVDPENENKVYATSFYDGKVNSIAGISVSNDGGHTWIHPVSAIPPAGAYTTPDRRNEPSAFGISINPESPQNVYVGTNAGLAISNNSGLTWRFVDPTPEDGADNVWDVIVHHGGIIDLTGDDGHQRSVDGGVTWTTADRFPLPSGRSSITVSPDESYVLFAVVGRRIFESDDGGASWVTELVNRSPQGRIPFIATNKRSSNSFDLWFGDVWVWRTECTTPSSPSPGGASRAQLDNWSGPFKAEGHADVGAIAFDPTTSIDACPIMYTSDGGVFINSLTTNPACHDPIWKHPEVTPNSLWLWSMARNEQPGIEDLYIGSQDNGIFTTTSSNSVNPVWKQGGDGDVFNIAAASELVQYTHAVTSTSMNILLRNRGLVGGAAIGNYPPGLIGGFSFGVRVAWYGPKQSIALTSSGAFVTSDITLVPIQWIELGAASKPPNQPMCNVKISQSEGSPTFYVQTNSCNGSNPAKLWRFNGTDPNGIWAEVITGGDGIGIFDVDATNPNHIVASRITNIPGGKRVEMISSNNGGTNWNSLAGLDNLMTGGGIFRYDNRRGPTTDGPVGGYIQPSLVSISPKNSKIIVAGAIDAGIFLSTDRGSSWKLITDPISPGISGIPHIPRPRFAFFDHNKNITSKENQQWHQNSPDILGKAEKDDMFASTLASGDFNGDGIMDLAVGVPDESLETDNTSIEKSGVVHILYGGTNNLSANNNQQWHQNINGMVGNAERNDLFGFSLAAGDFNGDGFSDLAVGVPNEGLKNGNSTIEKAGIVQVIYGTSSGLLSNGNQQWHQNSMGILGKAEANDQFGSSLAAGDFNHDGFVDLAIGVPNEGLESNTVNLQKAGVVHILYGSRTGLSARFNQQWQQNTPGILGKAEKNDLFGSSLSAGDFNNDGFADLVIGVPNESFEGVGGTTTVEKAGLVQVLYGSSSRLRSNFNQVWHQGSSGIIGAVEKNDMFGSSLATGDFNNDGFFDLAIGVPNEGFESEHDIEKAGVVQVIYGSVNRLASSNNQQWHQAISGVIGNAESGDLFGSSLTSGDFNGDGFGDLAIGVPNESIETNDETITKAGAINVLYGSTNGISTNGNQQWYQNSPGILGKAEKEDLFGSSVVAADFNGDGFCDLAIGVPNEGIEGDDQNIEKAGAVNILYGSKEIIDIFVASQGKGAWRFTLK